MPVRRRFRYYLLFTLIFGAFWFLFKLGGALDALKALRSAGLDAAVVLAGVILVVEWLLPVFFYRGRYRAFGLGAALAVGCLGSLNILSQLALSGLSLAKYHFALARYHEHFYYWFWSDLVAGSYFMIAVFVTGAMAIRLALDRADQGKRLAELESEKLRSELESLRNQINPHFIFNALNTIYYTIDSSNRNARDLTDKFASLLRYQLYECNGESVEIDKEMGFIGDYIALQRQRNGESLQVSCEGLHNLSGFRIPPHLLMPLVENCFKHVSRHPGRPNIIEVETKRKDNIFEFRTRNSFSPGSQGYNKGLGLLLTHRRLELLGGKRGRLLTDATDEFFQTTLTLDLT